MTEQCEHALLAHGVAAEVAYCRKCGVFHVNVDALTLRFRATARRDVRDTLSAALAVYERLALESAAEQAVSPPRVDVH